MNIRKYTKGFTLLELLVVISIIGILTAIGAASFTTAQKKGRDAARRGDLKALQNAYEQYYAQNDGVYPTNCDSFSDPTILSVIPQDPKPTNDPYAFTCDEVNGASYCVCAALEQAGTGNASANDCTFAAGGDYFCVNNLQ